MNHHLKFILVFKDSYRVYDGALLQTMYDGGAIEWTYIYIHTYSDNMSLIHNTERS